MTTAVLAPSAGREDEAAAARRPWYVRFWRSRSAAFGAIIVAIVGLCAIFAPWLAPHDPTLQDLSKVAQPPAWLGGSTSYFLGTDNLGRDILSRIIWGSRISATVGLSVVLIGGTLGVALGLIAGYTGGWVDALIARVADVQLAFPFVLLAVAIVAVVGPGLWTIILVLGLTSWVQYVRVVRAETLSAREREYVTAAEATGVSTPRILVRHVLPNVASSIIVLGTFEVARTVILESALSFLGLGVPPPTPSWGAMLADARQYLDTAWWMGTFPGLAIMIAVMGVNVLGDGLRDVLDPRQRL